LLFRLIHDFALVMNRERCGQAERSRAGAFGSQNMKAPCPAEHGGDGGKAAVNRSRHMAYSRFVQEPVPEQGLVRQVLRAADTR